MLNRWRKQIIGKSTYFQSNCYVIACHSVCLRIIHNVLRSCTTNWSFFLLSVLCIIAGRYSSELAIRRINDPFYLKTLFSKPSLTIWLNSESFVKIKGLTKVINISDSISRGTISYWMFTLHWIITILMFCDLQTFAPVEKTEATSSYIDPWLLYFDVIVGVSKSWVSQHKSGWFRNTSIVMALNLTHESCSEYSMTQFSLNQYIKW